MPLEIRSTYIFENKSDNATVELVISDNEEADNSSETLHIQILLPLSSDSYLPNIQMNTMKRAKQILDEIEQAMKLKWCAR